VSFANPSALWLLALAIPVVALHVLRPRRLPHTVSSTMLWEQASTPVTAAAPWQRLRPSVLLFLQLALVAGLAVAAAQPVRTTEVPLAMHTVFVLDGSGSMLATDGAPDRLSEAKDRAVALREQLPPGGQASLVVAEATPRVLLTASDDPQAFRDALAPVRGTSGVADVAGALSLATSLETPDMPIGFVLLTDGTLAPEAVAAIPAGTRDERVGRDGTNRALAALSVIDRGTGLDARVTVTNTGGPAATQVVRVDVDGRTEHRQEVRLEPGASEDLEVDLPRGQRIEVFLDGTDLLGADDRAVAVATGRRDLRVLVVGPEEPFLEEALAAIPGVTVERSDEPTSGTGHDLVVYHRTPVPADAGAPVLAVATPGVPGAVTTAGVVAEPVPTLVRTDVALLEGLDLSNVAIAEAQAGTVTNGDVLVGAEGAPLLARGVAAGRPYAWLAFTPSDSNLVLDVAFPLLVDRLAVDLTGAATTTTGLVVGEPLPLERGLAATVIDPSGAATPIVPGRLAPVADRAGFWTVQVDGRPDELVAVNTAPEESELQPAPPLPVTDPPDAVAGARSTGQLPLLRWLVPILLVLLLAEVLVARRRVGVSAGQWRGAVALRALIAVALVAAVLAPALRRDANRVASVFVIDASDSMGGAGRAEAVAWVQDALDEQPDGSRAGVVLFGADGRIERSVATDVSLGTPGVQVDSSATDLAAALRLASAILPSDARRRVVVVSDGRPTRGDEVAEIDRLVDAGIVVEAHAVGRPGGAGDAALVGIEGPSQARVGEQVTLDALVDAGRAGPATLVLDRDGQPIESRAVDLPAGRSTHAFTVVADGEGVARYRVRLDAEGDDVEQNDTSFAAVSIDGPARVLVAEGSVGVGATVSAALAAGGVPNDVIRARDLPALDTVAQYTSVVLVDVDRMELSDEQVATLDAATGDLGVGLVTVGGLHSYALGGWRDSDLEKLLPVVSEIEDPKRRRSVAQVLAIDTSGSMSACHCADGGNGLAGGGNRVGGGVSKTDIARSAAARSIDALAPNDEIGVLAIDSDDRWVIDLQSLPSDDTIEDGLSELVPQGETDLATSLETAAAELRSSQASLKHVVLFTDGFTQPDVLVELEADAAGLYDEGITVSVLGTGEGAAAELEAIAEAGGGRFYPGRDLQDIPQIMQQEVVLASRDFIQEGEFLPVVSGASPVTEGLEATPPLLGYVATTAKPTATQALRIGPELDPLLATWQFGLGRVSSWTSDGGERWAQTWGSWDGAVSFWTTMVKDTFPSSDGDGAVRASVSDGMLRVEVQSETAFADGTTVTARVTGPDLEGVDVELTATDASTFAGEVPTAAPGTYAVGARLVAPDGTEQVTSTLASQGYSPEYLPGEPDPALLTSLSTTTGGRGLIEPGQAFDAAGVPAGHQRIVLAGWLLLLAALAWPVAVAASRLARKGWLAPAVADGARRGVSRFRAALPGGPTAARTTSAPTKASTTTAPTEPARSVKPLRPSRAERRGYVDSETEARRKADAAPPATLEHLLRRKRGDDDSTGIDGDDA